MILDPGGLSQLNNEEIRFSVESTFLLQYWIDNSINKNV